MFQGRDKEGFAIREEHKSFAPESGLEIANDLSDMNRTSYHRQYCDF